MHFHFRQDICIHPAYYQRLSITRQDCYYGKRFYRKRNVNERNSQNVRRKQEGREKKKSSFLGLSILKEMVTMKYLTITYLGKQPHCKNCRRHQGKHGRFPDLKDLAFWLGNPAIISTDG